MTVKINHIRISISFLQDFEVEIKNGSKILNLNLLKKDQNTSGSKRCKNGRRRGDNRMELFLQTS